MLWRHPCDPLHGVGLEPCSVCGVNSVAVQFHEMKQESDGQSPLLTQEQQQWITVQHMVVSTSVEVRECSAHY